MAQHLTCSCCGGDAGRWTQWHNRDDGYGICRGCVDWIKSRAGTWPEAEPDAFRRNYGVEGVNYAPAPA